MNIGVLPLRPLALTAIGLAVSIVSCRHAPRAIVRANGPIPGCYLLSYREWGSPPRMDGEALPGAPGSEFMILERRLVPDSLRFSDDTTSRFVARWYYSVRDTDSYSGQWRPVAHDSIWVGFYSMPLYGVTATFKQQGDSLLGRARTFSDVVGVKQGASDVVGRRVPCGQGT